MLLSTLFCWCLFGIEIIKMNSANESGRVRVRSKKLQILKTKQEICNNVISCEMTLNGCETAQPCINTISVVRSIVCIAFALAHCNYRHHSLQSQCSIIFIVFETYMFIWILSQLHCHWSHRTAKHLQFFRCNLPTQLAYWVVAAMTFWPHLN